MQELTNIAPRQFLIVKEPSKLIGELQPQTGQFQVTVTGGKGLVYRVGQSTDLVAWTSLAYLTNQTGMAIWTNPSPARGSLFLRASE